MRDVQQTVRSREEYQKMAKEFFANLQVLKTRQKKNIANIQKRKDDESISAIRKTLQSDI